MKKEKYFQEKLITVQSEQFLSVIEPFSKNREWEIQPNSTALLILDMQEYFLNPGSHAFIPSARAIIGPIKKLINKFKVKNYPIFLTRHLNTLENSKNMAGWWQELLVKDNPLSKISSLLPADGLPQMVKSQYDAFQDTSLEEILISKNISQVVITGVMTHLCCESTARSAFQKGFSVLFAVDATATYNREFHLASLTNLAHGFVTPVLSSEILRSLSGK